MLIMTPDMLIHSQYTYLDYG